ncbi:helix-turn-helix domain-containing protein [Ruegeria meonggei]|uniref:HTH-type transcriptional regulator VirS n=1 Tax=Ruegeria meonggei TaxID=1446476 RepID=A0A1X6YU47_9RHOB|nr:AraC family transcriptional regulator [Ruegeria meonggei]SLN31301.1 HTH-type transcriptional regulator VirS [Ruegeria meonggei]
MEVHISRIQLLTRSLDQQAETPDTADRILDKCGLDRAAIAASDTTYTATQEALFVRYACDALGDITFAAQAGMQFTSSSSLTAYISKYSRDLRQVIENTSRFHGMIDPAIFFSLRHAGNFATIEADWKDASYARYHRRTEFLMFAGLARMRSLTQSNFYPIEIRFQHEVGENSKQFQKLAGFPVVFGAERLEFVLALSSLDIPVPTYDSNLREHLLEYGERVMAERRSPKQRLRAQVEGLITRSLPGAIIQAEDVAANLGMSPRTFARRLKDEGASYRDIVDDLRCDLAQTFITNGMPLSEIAFSLGYADQPAFSTAFKRWTGLAPSSFRSRLDFPVKT